MPSLGYEPYDGCEVCAVSLGICAVRAAIRPDLRGRLSASDRERPLFTGVNGPLMPGDPSPTCADRVPCSFPVLLDGCHPSGRGRRVQAKPLRGRFASLDTADSPETTEQRGGRPWTTRCSESSCRARGDLRAPRPAVAGGATGDRRYPWLTAHPGAIVTDEAAEQPTSETRSSRD